MRITNKSDFIDYLKRVLGGEYIPSEISVNNWDDIIQDAIDYFGEYIPGFSKTEAIKITTEEGVQEYDLDTSIISVDMFLDRSVYNDLFYNTFTSSERSPDYAVFISSLSDFMGSNLFEFEIKSQHMRMFRSIFKTRTEWEFRQHTSTLYFHKPPLAETYLLIVTKAFDIDGTGGGYIWNMKVFKDYCTALAYQQLYRNVAKFDGFSLPGGGTLNMSYLEKEGPDRVRELEEWFQSNYTEPFDIVIA
jgi:hypothetical protein